MLKFLREMGKVEGKVKIYQVQSKSSLMSSSFMVNLNEIRCGLTNS